MEGMFYKRESFVCCAQHCGGFQGLCVVSTFIRSMLVVWSAAGSSILTHLFFLCSRHTNTPSLALVYTSSKKIFLFAHQFWGFFFFCKCKRDLR